LSGEQARQLPQLGVSVGKHNTAGWAITHPAVACHNGAGEQKRPALVRHSTHRGGRRPLNAMPLDSNPSKLILLDSTYKRMEYVPINSQKEM
jgi:hypothetical protein